MKIANHYNLYKVEGKVNLKIAASDKNNALQYLKSELGLTNEELGNLELRVLSKNFILAKEASTKIKNVNIPKSYYNQPVEDIFCEDSVISRRVLSLFKHYQIENLGQLLETSAESLLDYRGLGIETFDYIAKKLDEKKIKTYWSKTCQLT